MAQNYLKFGSFTPPDVDEDGYQISFATTSTENSGRTMRGILSVYCYLLNIIICNMKFEQML